MLNRESRSEISLLKPVALILTPDTYEKLKVKQQNLCSRKIVFSEASMSQRMSQCHSQNDSAIEYDCNFFAMTYLLCK